MRIVFLMMLIVVMAACQQEELTVVDAQEEESFLLDRELTTMISSVTSHDGSFDDVVDGSSCFSIDFPYTCYYNGNAYSVDSIDDLAPFDKGDKLYPKFPIDITYANYEQATVSTQEEFDLLKMLCENGEMYNQSITCIDFIYPVRVAVYNSETSDFETILFEHDKQTFLSIEDFDPGTLANIQYPINVLLETNDIVTITSNDLLKTIIMDMIPLCE